MKIRSTKLVKQSKIIGRLAIVTLLAVVTVFGTLSGLPEHSQAQTGETETAPPSEATRQPSDRANDRLTTGLQAHPGRPIIRIRRGEVGPLVDYAQRARQGRPDGRTPRQSLEPPTPFYEVPAYSLLAEEGWTELYTEDFEAGIARNPLWQSFDFSESPLERQWGTVNLDPTGSIINQVLWPAAAGSDAVDWQSGYPANLDSWLDYGPLNFSDYSDVLVGFGLWHDIDDVSEVDALYFCASIDAEEYDCFDTYWDGESFGWLDEPFWLDGYAGYEEVWLAWIFVSDEVENKGFYGPFIDEVHVWGLDFDAAPLPEPTPDAQGSLVQNGSFEDGLTGWQQESDVPISAQAVEVTDEESLNGDHAVRLRGTQADYLYQTITIPDNVWNLDISFWFTLESDEIEPYTDWFCASMTETGNREEILVDLGCFDTSYADEFEDYWETVLFSLFPEEVQALRNQTVDLVFELYNQGDTDSITTVYLDEVHVYVSGGDGAAYLDENEFNDFPQEATPISCGETKTGYIGNALGGYDVDWFVIDNVPAGRLAIDINAATLVPASPLDSVVYFYDTFPNLDDEDLEETAFNDDDPLTTDSFITYTVASDAGPYYVEVVAYDEFAEPNSNYEIVIRCADSGRGPTTGGDAPIARQPRPDTWTLMLYLNAEDPNFEKTLTKYRTDLEAMIGSKRDFLTITILYDGPMTSTRGVTGSNTIRYVVQPDGDYTNNRNRWNMNELNMGDPRTLAEFVKWSMDRYPAENYFLALDDHGDGAYSISKDETSNDALTPNELYAALKEATQNGQRKIDILDYEACLMGLVENVYDVKDFVTYQIFFEQISWGIDTYPQYFRDLAATDEPKDVGKKIVERYHEQAKLANGGFGYPHTISMIDVGGIEAVTSRLNAFTTQLSRTATITQINRLRSQSQAFANTRTNQATNPRYADYIDLWDFADKASVVVPTEAGALKTAVENAVVAEYKSSGLVSGTPWRHAGARGLAVYFPASQFSEAFSQYGNRRLSQRGRWDEFLNHVVPAELIDGGTPGGTGRGNSARGNSARGNSARGNSARAQDKLTTASDVDPTTRIIDGERVYLPVVIKQ